MGYYVWDQALSLHRPLPPPSVGRRSPNRQTTGQGPQTACFVLGAQPFFPNDILLDASVHETAEEGRRALPRPASRPPQSGRLPPAPKTQVCAVLGMGWGRPSLEIGLLRLLQGEVGRAGSLVQLPPRGRDTDLPPRTPSSLSAGVGWGEGARRLGTWVCVCRGSEPARVRD